MPKFDRVLLYIGAPKTGTTTNQVAVWANRDALKDHGVFVPKAGQRGVQHMDLPATVPNRVTAGLARHANIDSGNLGERREAFLTALHGELDQAPSNCHTLLLMSEYLFGATRRDIEAFRACFAPHSRRLECLLYLRRQDEWLASLALQARKAGSRSDFQLRPGPPGQFGANVRAWRGLADACHIRRFDSKYFVDGDLFTDFRSAIGAPAEAFPNSKPSANPTLLQEQLELIDVLNLKLAGLPFHERIPIRRKFVGFCTKTVGGSRIEVCRDDAIKAFEAYNGINRWLAATLDPEGPPRFFGEDFSHYPLACANDRQYSVETLERLASALGERTRKRLATSGALAPGAKREAVIEAIADAFILMRQGVLARRRAPRADEASSDPVAENEEVPVLKTYAHAQGAIRSPANGRAPPARPPGFSLIPPSEGHDVAPV